MVVVKLMVRMVVAESHDEERKKRETMVEKKEGKLIFYRLWPLISPSSNHEIHLYL
jgi:hypothetical protein